MNYIFGFNVGVKLFQKFPKFKIYAGGRLIDDLRLEDSDLYKDNYVSERKEYDAGPYGDEFYYRERFVSNKLHTYEIDEKYLNDKITIEISNSDSNYTNGFMTKSTLVYFSYIFLIPLKLFSNIPELLEKVKKLNQKFENIENNYSSKMVHAWPILTRDKNTREYMGGDTILNFPLAHNMKYIHFDNIETPPDKMTKYTDFDPTDIRKDPFVYIPANELGFEDNTKQCSFINVSTRFLRHLKKIINK